MDKKIAYCLFLISFCCANLSAQVTFGNKITLTGDIDEDRQVVGISSTPSSLNQAVNVEVVQTNYLKYAEAMGDGNAISIILPIAPLQYSEGMSIYFKANQNNSGSVTLNVNGLGIIPIRKNVSEELQQNEIISGQIVHVIFDGSSFQILSDLQKTCPTGFVKVSNSYCIEANERTPANFFDAILTCASVNARLCHMDEWYYACQDVNASSSLTNITGNYEWLNEGGNNYSIALTDANTASVIGESDCTDLFTGPIRLDSTNDFNLLPYRCCMRIK